MFQDLNTDFETLDLLACKQSNGFAGCAEGG